MNNKWIVTFIVALISLQVFAQDLDFQKNVKLIETENGTFSTIDYGPKQGDPILLLHGFPDSKELWKYQISALGKAGYRVIAPDLRGYGNSPSPLEKEKYAIPILMKDVLGILNSLKIDQVHIVGHDWGAALTWQLAKYYGHLFKSVTVLSVGYPDSPAWNSIEQKQKSWYFYLFLQEGLAEKTLADYDWELAKKTLKSHKEMDKVLANFQKPNSLTTALNWYRGNLQHLLYKPNTNYKVTNEKKVFPKSKMELPVLGIWSSGDNYLTEAPMKASANYIKDFTYKKIKGAGHWMMLDKPKKVNKLILDFLKKQK